MKSTLTVRLDDRQAKTLSELSRRLGRSTSDLVREALDALMAERSIAERASQYKGRLKLPAQPASDFRDQIRERNWRS